MSPSRRDARRFVCIHGHFYQPPRENAWLERVELQESAHPYHDWNERIDAECYGPNATSRILDAHDRILRIVNNYESISFNFGPTLLSWLETHSAETYAAILAADRRSRERFGGHGSAMAQVYNHAILPLCNPRDRRTQVLWGIRDFERRFGRSPEGMWLPETAVDLASLEALAEAGIRFTVLEPSQAAEVLLPGSATWVDVADGGIDTRRPWRLRLDSGREIALFFYDGERSRAVAFERLLSSGKGFLDRLLDGFSDEDDSVQLVHIATDGETYGHHHRFGDMALAWAIDAIERDGQARLTNYGEFLELFPPEGEVRIRENTAWSCAHGLGRWSRDCGCRIGGEPDWNQAWRGPLRAALDHLRDAVAGPWEELARRLFRDPWAARDAYVDVILDRSRASVDRFLGEHGKDPLSSEERTTALQAMELQRHAQLMYTSCGWFFDELSGVESRQILQYAGRVTQLAETLLAGFSAEPFLERLESAPSNDPAFGDGRSIYESTVRPASADLERVAANHGARLLFDEAERPPSTSGFEVVVQDRLDFKAEDARATLCRMELRSRITEERASLLCAVIHSPDHEAAGAIGTCDGSGFWASAAEELARTFESNATADALERVRPYLPLRSFTLDSLFRDEQQIILGRILESTLDDVEQVYHGLHERHARMLRRLAGLGTGQPRALRVASELVLNTNLQHELSAADPDAARLAELLGEAEAEKISLDRPALGFQARATLERLVDTFGRYPDDLERLDRLTATARFVRRLPFHVDLRAVENRCYELSRSIYPTRCDEASAGGTDSAAWAARFRELASVLRISLE